MAIKDHRPRARVSSTNAVILANSMKNLHYRTHSLPESAYTAQLLHSTQPADYQAGTPPKRVRAGVRRSC